MENTNTFGTFTLYFVEEGTRDETITTAWFSNRKDAVSAFGSAKARLESLRSVFPEPGDYVVCGEARVDTLQGVAVLLNRGRYVGIDSGVTITVANSCVLSVSDTDTEVYSVSDTDTE